MYILTNLLADENVSWPLMAGCCRFLQGKDSNPNAIRQISMACKLQKEIRVILLNYKKDGTPFWNLLHITPVKDSDGNLISFVGVQMDVSERCAEGHPPSIDTSFT